MLGTKSFYATPVVATLDPVVVVNSEVFTDVVDMSLYQSVQAVLMLGDVASEGIVFRCVACDANGANPTATLSGKSVTILAHASNNDGTQHAITVSADDLFKTQPTKQYIKFGVVTDDVVGGPMAIEVRADPARYYVGANATDSIGGVVV